MKIRELRTSDIFKVSKILKKMNLKIEGEKQEEVGKNLIMAVFENLHLAEDEVNEFVGGLVGLKPEEFAELPLPESIKIIMDLKEILPSFFTSAKA